VLALTAQLNLDRLLAQCVVHRPDYAVIADATLLPELQLRLRAAHLPTEALGGAAALAEVASLPQADIVMAAIVGAAGLLPTLAAVQSGKRVLLANKEALVMAGSLFIAAARQGAAQIVPVDSEHNAVFQCLPPSFVLGLAPAGVRRILLTASGGPLRETPLADLAAVTPEQACAHPNWSMGRKISVDSATMMNKGLEVIEAHWLFGLAQDCLEVVIHPQSLIHSLVEFTDGTQLAQLGQPDMRIPIAHALGWPERLESGAARLDLTALAGGLQFSAPDLQRYPCLSLAYQALQQGGTAPAALNAANEVAVAAFLAGQIRFTEIAMLVQTVLAAHSVQVIDNLATVLAADAAARRQAEHWLETRND
jgi:1-deoxy-D-xylulose-5-phosphate reductoisomerase